MDFHALPLHDEMIRLDTFLRSLRKYELETIHQILFPNHSEKTPVKRQEMISSILLHVNQTMRPFQIKQKKQEWQASRPQWAKGAQVISPVQTIRTPLMKKKQSQIRKKHTSTTKFLTFMKKNMGNLNSYMKCAYNIGNVCGKRKFTTAIQNKTCSLASQCFVTSQTINYMFSKENAVIVPFHPSLDFLTNWKTHLLPGMVGNINITVGSTKEGFPGHICNVVVIKELNGSIHGYLIQSYIQNYTIDWQSLNWEEIQNVLLDYNNIFWNSSSFIFTLKDEELWKALTKVDKLKAFDGTSLIETPKPPLNSCSMSYTVMYVFNLGDYLQERYHSLLRKCTQNIENERCAIQNAFGPYLSREQLHRLLDQESRRISF